MKAFKKGEKVHWKWAGGIVDGKVEEIYLRPIEMEIKGSKIKRNGSKDRPAYLVRSESGNIALKLQTELMKDN